MTIGTTWDAQGFDQVVHGAAHWPAPLTLVYESLLMGNQAWGPAGTGETDFVQGGIAPYGFFRNIGQVAESWEIPDNQTHIYKIRKGIYWDNKPPVNGRELNAKDVAYSIKYWYGIIVPPSAAENYDKPKVTYNIRTAPGGQRITSVETPDDWTIIIKVTSLAPVWLEEFGLKQWIYPPESVQQYGTLKDWRNSLGTGPFRVVDYVPGSVMVFERNENYWMTNPVGPGKSDRLPYLDGVKVLIIPDISTIVTGLRTGKIDQAGGGGGNTSADALFNWEDIAGLVKTNPGIKVLEVKATSFSGATVRTTSTDPLAAPLLNQKVRWALQMAIDSEAYQRDYLEGKGFWSYTVFPPGTPAYSTLDEQVEILEKVHKVPPEQAIMLKKVREYNPAEAKKLLAEAGYPNGFTTQVLLTNDDVDEYSIIKGYWDKIGVDLKLDVRERNVWLSARTAHTFAALLPGGADISPTRPEKWLSLGPGNPDRSIPRNVTNYPELIDPVVNAAIELSDKNYGDYDMLYKKIMKETEPYLSWLNWKIRWPNQSTYTVWQPWVKNYYGQRTYGVMHHYVWSWFLWYDQDLKTSMGYK